MRDSVEALSSPNPGMEFLYTPSRPDGAPYPAKIWRIQKEKDILRQLQHSLGRLKNLMENTVEALASALEKRDPDTAGRRNRAGDLACAIAREMGLPEERLEVLRLAAFVHDIGKMGVPAASLTKPGALTGIEMSLIKVHCQAFFEILNTVEFPRVLSGMVFQHQDRVNGSGEPMMVLEARILAVAEVVAAMSSQGPCRPALELSGALEEISRNRGLYDGEVVDACLRLCHEKGFTFGSS